MKFALQRLIVGPWPVNCYLLRCTATGQIAIVDPGADAAKILSAIGDDQVSCILLTHGHPDHCGVLVEIQQTTDAPAGIHLEDAEAFGLEADFPLMDGMEIEVGRGRVKVAHVPGHTPGSICLRFNGQALVGDAIFPGGPGYTATPDALAQSLVSLGQTVFRWPKRTQLYPGHGGPTTVGSEKEAYKAFLVADHPPGLCGDVKWR